MIGRYSRTVRRTAPGRSVAPSGNGISPKQMYRDRFWSVFRASSPVSIALRPATERSAISEL